MEMIQMRDELVAEVMFKYIGNLGIFGNPPILNSLIASWAVSGERIEWKEGESVGRWYFNRLEMAFKVYGIAVGRPIFTLNAYPFRNGCYAWIQDAQLSIWADDVNRNQRTGFPEYGFINRFVRDHIIGDH